ncbi:MAG: hypothetical protein IKG84_04265 [Bacteroidales bacterium]|nr:hypothetical protein [Bacteroidales bacterium]
MTIIFKEKINNIKPIKFYKDNEDNHHINFMMLMINLRAKNYQIKEWIFFKN